MTKCRLGFQAIVFLSIAVGQMASLDAHPPEFHQKGVKVSTASTLAGNKQPVEEFDRQFAYFQFEFLAAYHLYDRCKIADPSSSSH